MEGSQSYHLLRRSDSENQSRANRDTEQTCVRELNVSMPSAAEFMQQLPKEPPDKGVLVGRPAKNGRRVEIHSPADGLKAMHSLELKNTLASIIGKPLDINRIYSGKSAGNVMVHCADENQTSTLLSSNLFGNLEVVSKLPARWNTVQGVISGRDLRDMSDGEILIGQNEGNGLIDAFHFPYYNKTTKIRENSNTVCITFDSKILPQFVHIGFIRYPVSPYYPSPMRCYRCQLFGHTLGRCPASNEMKCAKCACAGHDDKACTVSDPSLYKCVNCDLAHPSWSKDCKKYIKEKDVCIYRVQHDVSYYEARTAIFGSAKDKRSYADVSASTVSDSAAKLPLIQQLKLVNQLIQDPAFQDAFVFDPTLNRFIAKPRVPVDIVPNVPSPEGDGDDPADDLNMELEVTPEVLQLALQQAAVSPNQGLDPVEIVKLAVGCAKKQKLTKAPNDNPGSSRPISTPNRSTKRDNTDGDIPLTPGKGLTMPAAHLPEYANWLLKTGVVSVPGSEVVIDNMTASNGS